MEASETFSFQLRLLRNLKSGIILRKVRHTSKVSENTRTMSEVVSVPRELKDVFKGVSAEVQTYLNTAQKFSKQQKHFYIGVEHLFAAFLSEHKSLIRRILSDDKSNWKKRVQDLLMKAYNPSKKNTTMAGYTCLHPGYRKSGKQAHPQHSLQGFH